MNWNRLIPTGLAALTLTLSAATLPHAAQGYAGSAGGPNTFTAARAQAALAADTDPFWRAALAGSAATEARTVAAAAHPSVLVRGNTARKEIALTFDDGPHPAYTPQLLEVLKEYHVPATFFLVGEMAERYPDLVREEVADGQTIGNHTYHHVSLVKVNAVDDAAEIAACGDVLKNITGKRPYLFRPPGGRLDPSALDAAEAQGYTTVMWTDDPGDYASPGVDKIVDRTLHCARPGGILLLHDGIPQTIAALPRIVTTLRAEGFTFVSMDQMLRDRADLRSMPIGPEIAPLPTITHVREPHRPAPVRQEV